MNRPESLPPFQSSASASGILSDSEIDQLIADYGSRLTEGILGPGNADASIRRSQTFFFQYVEEHRWLYERIWEAASECNRNFFCVDISGIEGNIQLARYDSSDEGFYNWHTDFAGIAPGRKISVSIQLSAADAYEGGDLELLFREEPVKLDRTRGTLCAFPSFMLHRVTPVTRGTRWSLVAWITGPRWR
jgi:predicted 2-oxoglutarate/Fe(II)-dependent dioxygenase YbiX